MKCAVMQCFLKPLDQCDVAEELLPALQSMQQEPAWAAIMAGHGSDDWPGQKPPARRHQDLVYLAAEKILSAETAQTIHSFYSFMLVRV